MPGLWNWKLITFKIDTGADTSVITEVTYNSPPVKTKLQKPKNKLYGSGEIMQWKGMFVARTPYKNNKIIIFECLSSRILIAVLTCYVDA